MFGRYFGRQQVRFQVLYIAPPVANYFTAKMVEMDFLPRPGDTIVMMDGAEAVVQTVRLFVDGTPPQVLVK